MKKGVKIAIGIVVVILLAAVFLFKSVTGEKTTPAYLVVDSGTVFVNGVLTQNEQDLKKGDIIRTESGEATVILYDSIIISLESNSEISLEALTKDHPQVKQVSGSIWTKFADVVGIQQFDVQTPNTVATVRGTEFGVDVDGNNTVVPVGEGTVDVDGRPVNAFQQARKQGFTEVALEQLSPEQKRKMLFRMERTLQKMMRHREREIFVKEQRLLSLARKKATFSDDEIRQYLRDIDAGTIDDAAMLKKSPIRVQALYKIKRMNDRIKEQQRVIQLVRQSLGE
jgi:hypothetical protein